MSRNSRADACFHVLRAWIVVASLSGLMHAEGPKPAVEAPGPLSPGASAAKMKLAAGFRIELIASEPLVTEPTCVAFDERGRLFVCELHGFNMEGQLDVAELNKTGKVDTSVRRIRWERLAGRFAELAKKNQYGTIKRLIDSDGDGRMDRAEIWADRLPPCYGIVPARGGLIVVCAPEILFLADRDGDGKAEVRETLFTGFRREFIERGINNPRWGVNNWIYVGSGGDGGTIRGPRLDKPVQFGRSDFRIRPDGSAIEPVTGQVRTFGLTLDEIGDRFTTAGGTPVAVSLPLPYRSLQRNPFVTSPPSTYVASNYNRAFGIAAPHPWRVRRGQDPDWVKFYGRRETSNGYFTSGCGTEIYRADLFPQARRGNLFCCEPSNNMVHFSVLTRDGAGWRARRDPHAEKTEFLASSDPWFRPVNLRVGPGGGLYVVDMYREIIEDYSAIPRFLQQQYGLAGGRKHGRIWRVVPTGAGPTPPVSLATASNRELLQSLQSPNAWRRQTGQRVLIERGDRSVVAALIAILRDRDNPFAQARLHALRTLEGLGALRAAHLRDALGDPHYGVRVHALQLSEALLATEPELLARVLRLTDDPDPRARLELAMTLGESPDPAATTALLKLAVEHGHERWMASAILSASRDRAAALLAAILHTSRLTPGARSLLTPLATTVGGQGDVPGLVGVLTDAGRHDVAVQQACLAGLIDGLSRHSNRVLKSAPSWRPIQQLVSSRSPQVRRLAIRLGARLGFSEKPEMRAAFGRAARESVNADRSVEKRIAAIRLLADAPYATMSDTAISLLAPEHPPSVQLAAIESLKLSSDGRSAAALLHGWRGFTPGLRAAVLDAIFSRQDRLAPLLDAIEKRLIGRGEVDASRRDQLVNNRDKRVAARARTLFAGGSLGAELERRIARYQKALARRRDVKRGRSVFEQHCLACHRLKNEGHAVGPDLAGIAGKPDEAIVLELLNPNDSIEPRYRSYTVVTTAGRIHIGMLASESATSVTLRRAKNMTDTILRTQIESMTASSVSLMPANLYQQISPSDAADLIGYLKQALKPVDSTKRRR